MTDGPTSPGEDAPSTPLLTIEGTRATIRLNRPRHLNRLQPEDLGALMALFDRVEADPALRVLVLTGTGRDFMTDVEHEHDDDVSSFVFRAERHFDADRLEDLALPTICRINGGVYGGSTDLALACDFRIGIDSGEMFMPAARLGLHYYPNGIKRYVSRLGIDNAKRLFLTAERIDAREMLRIGYLTAMVAADALDGEVERVATILAGNAPEAMRGMKRAINEFARGALDDAAARRRHLDSMSGAEISEGMKSFAEKRRPRF